ncbi:MAG: tRNA pseudouridine(38-40) synthase TruA [Planctomycetota bacterium]|jgi:tRNA pseudouridine38-40 synthase
MSETPNNPPTRNIKLVIAYNGAAYHGWQRQTDELPTIQQAIEDAATRVMGHRVVLHGAGRTDAGVHAEGQVANFHTPNLAIPLVGVRRAIQSRLPGDIAIRSATEVADDFHASRSAVGKTYRYRIHVGRDRPVGVHQLVWHYAHHHLDISRMQDAARRLIGTHDFRGFATSAEQRDDTVRTIFRCEVAEVGREIHVAVQGDGFLYNMVRNIVGTLAEIGRGQRWRHAKQVRLPDRIDRILATRDRRNAGQTAPPDGLTLACVHY